MIFEAATARSPSNTPRMRAGSVPPIHASYRSGGKSKLCTNTSHTEGRSSAVAKRVSSAMADDRTGPALAAGLAPPATSGGIRLGGVRRQHRVVVCSEEPRVTRSSTPADLHEWVSFDDPDADRTWVFDVTFLASNWTCIF